MSSLEDMTQAERESIAFRKLMNDPEVGIQAKRLYKKVVPDAKFADLDIEDKFTERESKLQKRMDEMEEKDMERRVKEQRELNHKMLRDRGLDPTVVEKVMTDEKIMNYDTAAKYIESQNRNSAPSPGNVTPISMPDNAKEIAKNPAAWARTEAFKALNELKAKRAQ